MNVMPLLLKSAKATELSTPPDTRTAIFFFIIIFIVFDIPYRFLTIAEKSVFYKALVIKDHG